MPVAVLQKHPVLLNTNIKKLPNNCEKRYYGHLLRTKTLIRDFTSELTTFCRLHEYIPLSFLSTFSRNREPFFKILMRDTCSSSRPSLTHITSPVRCIGHGMVKLRPKSTAMCLISLTFDEPAIKRQ